MNPPPGASGPAPEDAHPVILFDGFCNLCNGGVRFIIRRDRSRRFRFAPLESSAFPHSPRSGEGGTFLLLEEGRRCDRSTAVLRIALHLGWPWKLAYAFIAVPPAWRDALYDFIAAHRYAWFGTRDRCMTPPPEWADRFPGRGSGTM